MGACAGKGSSDRVLVCDGFGSGRVGEDRVEGVAKLLLCAVTCLPRPLAEMVARYACLEFSWSYAGTDHAWSARIIPGTRSQALLFTPPPQNPNPNQNENYRILLTMCPTLDALDPTDVLVRFSLRVDLPGADTNTNTNTNTNVAVRELALEVGLSRASKPLTTTVSDGKISDEKGTLVEMDDLNMRPMWFPMSSGTIFEFELEHLWTLSKQDCQHKSDPCQLCTYYPDEKRVAGIEFTVSIKDERFGLGKLSSMIRIVYSNDWPAHQIRPCIAINSRIATPMMLTLLTSH